MKITHISMKGVEKGVNPFYKAEWTEASVEKKAEVFGILSQFNKSRMKTA